MEFLTSTAGSLIIFVIGLAIFIALCFTKVPRIYAVLLAVLVFAFGINAEWTTSLFTTFLGGTVTVIQSYLFTTLSGAAVGCALAATGCANRIAETVMNLVGRQRGAGCPTFPGVWPCWPTSARSRLSNFPWWAFPACPT